MYQNNVRQYPSKYVNFLIHPKSAGCRAVPRLYLLLKEFGNDLVGARRLPLGIGLSHRTLARRIINTVRSIEQSGGRIAAVVVYLSVVHRFAEKRFEQTLEIHVATAHHVAQIESTAAALGGTEAAA